MLQTDFFIHSHYPTILFFHTESNHLYPFVSLYKVLCYFIFQCNILLFLRRRWTRLCIFIKYCYAPSFSFKILNNFFLVCEHLMMSCLFSFSTATLFLLLTLNVVKIHSSLLPNIFFFLNRSAPYITLIFLNVAPFSFLLYFITYIICMNLEATSFRWPTHACSNGWGYLASPFIALIFSYVNFLR